MKNRYAKIDNGDHYIITGTDNGYIAPLWCETDENLRVKDEYGVFLYKEIKSNKKIIPRENDTLSEYKEIRCDQAKQKAQEVILSLFPQWKQTSLIDDKEHAVSIILAVPTSSGDPNNSDAIIAELGSKIATKDFPELKSIYDDPSSVDISSITSQYASQYRPTIASAAQKGIRYIVSVLMKRSIRYWSDQKEVEMNAATNKADLFNITLDDYPKAE